MHREVPSQVNRGGEIRPAPGSERAWGKTEPAHRLVRRIPSGPEAVRAAQAAQCTIHNARCTMCAQRIILHSALSILH